MQSDPTDTRPVPVTPAGPLALVQAAIDRGMDAEQLGKLVDLAERMERNRAAERFALAVAAFQADCPAVFKWRTASMKSKEEGKSGPAYKFASYDDVMATAKPHLAKHGIAVTFGTESLPGVIKITCTVRVGTHTQDTLFTVPVPGNVPVNDTQKFGMALSYAKRYAICAALNIVVTDEDNDGQTLTETIGEAQVGVINGLLNDCRKNGRFKTPESLKSWFDWLQEGLERVEDIRTVEFGKATWDLNRRLDEDAAKKGASK